MSIPYIDFWNAAVEPSDADKSARAIKGYREAVGAGPKYPKPALKTAQVLGPDSDFDVLGQTFYREVPQIGS